VHRNPSEFVHFIARHYHLLEAMCQEHIGFQGDDEIAAFIRSHVDNETNPARKIHEMKRIGVLTQSTGEWAPPPFLVRFMGALHERHVLATPAVVRAWVEKLQRLARDLDRWLDERSRAPRGQVEDEEARSLLREIGDTIYVVSATIGENIECIGVEVAAYRATEDAGRMRSRLRRLIQLFDDFLSPIMRVLDVDGPFRAVTQQIVTQCAGMTSRRDYVARELADEARRLRQHVTWLRRTVLRQADEANAELAPLCMAATRESAIARGVNRALEVIRHGRWPVLDLEQHLPVIEDLDSNLAGDDAVRTFMQDIYAFRQQPPPLVTPKEPSTLSMPWTPEALRDRLHRETEVSDLLKWIISNCGTSETADSSINLLHGLLNIESERILANGRTGNYRFARVNVETHLWSWRNAHGD